MCVVRIHDVKATRGDRSAVVGFHLDQPRSGSCRETYDLPISGWIVTAQPEIVEMEVLYRGRVLRAGRADLPRPDITERYPHLPHAGRSGFSLNASMLGLPPDFQIVIRARCNHGDAIPLVTLEGCHNGVVASHRNRLRPIIVTMQGRVGSSWFMRLLSGHPRIAIYPEYPFETRAMSYWTHMLRVLGQPADHVRSTPAIDFTVDPTWIGHHPFYKPNVTQRPAMQEWFGRTYPEQLASFCKKFIDDFYLQVARMTDKPDAVCFAEKCASDETPWLIWELYPDAREVVLVRDFRDMLSSIFAFNKKRGYQSFGRERAKSDRDYIESMRNNVNGFVRAWKLRSDRAFLVRYEDLVLDTAATLGRLMEYLRLDGDIGELIAKANVPVQELTDHRTTQDVASSIGRWKRDLDPDLQRDSTDAFQEALATFGYE